MLNKLVAELADILTSKSDGYVRSCDNILFQIASLDDSKCIELLLPFLEDDAEYDELMFSIIHTIEGFDSDIFVNCIINNLSSFYAKSPGWAVVEHMRILNTPSTLAAYESAIGKLSKKQASVVRKVLTAVRKRNEKFKPAVTRLLAALK